MRTYDQDALKARLAQLSKNGRIAFAATCATRMLPLYEDYHERSGRGDPRMLHGALESAWSWVRGIRHEPQSYAANIEALTALLPEEEEGSVPPGRWAVDALSSAIYTIEAIVDSDLQRASWPAEQLVDAVEDFVRSEWFAKHGEVPSAQEELADPVMQTLLAQFERDLAELERMEPDKLADEVTRLKRRAESERPFPVQG